MRLKQTALKSETQHMELDLRTLVTSLALRIERHVESLAANPTAQADPRNGHGWEEASILALTRRVGHREFK